MKNVFWIITVMIVGLVQTKAQNTVALSDDGEFRIVERGLDHSVAERTSTEVIEGESRQVTKRFTTLATGMHREQGGKLVPCSAEIEVHAPNGAVAQKTRHKVIFSPNANDWNGAVDLLTPDNKRLRSRVLGIAYYDAATGESLLVAELKDSVGMLFPPSTIVYADAFTDVKADLEYQNRLSGFEQNLIFREQPPAPAEFGMGNDTTYVQLLTEFFEAPVPQKRSGVRNGMAVDHQLDFGSMKIPAGKSFLVGQERDGVKVDKQWKQLGGREFLIEQIHYSSIAPLLNTLPQAAQANKGANNPARRVASRVLRLPAKQIARTSTDSPVIQVASANRHREGFVLDYSIVASQNQDLTLQGDTTYYVNDGVLVDGTLTIQGGTVVKFNGGTFGCYGPIKTETDLYRPAVFTSVNDDTIGEILPASNHSPTRGEFLGFVVQNYGSLTDLRHIRVRYAYTAFEFDNPPTVTTLMHSQFTDGLAAINLINSEVRMRNVLFANFEHVICSYVGDIVYGEHLTCHRVASFATDSLTSLFLTNSLLVAVTNLGTSAYTFQDCVWTQAETPGIFQTVGAAGYYLADRSPYRDTGAVNINAGLLNDLKLRTTFPPMVYSSGSTELNLDQDLALRPQAERDTSLPDLGYHYSPIDFAFGYTSITNGTITVQPGTVIATFNPLSSQMFGLRPTKDGSLSVTGSATQPAWIIRYNTVQEGQGSAWAGAASPSIYSPINNFSTSIAFTFCNFSVMANDTRHFYGNGGSIPTVKFKECQFAGGELLSFRPSLTVTNCLFERTLLTVDSGTFTDTALQFHNNLFYRNTITVSNRVTANTWAFTNNYFDRVTIKKTGLIGGNYNGYIIGSNTVSSGANDVAVSDVSYENGALGRFYQSSASGLLNVGSTTTDLVGLYHYTTGANDVKEGTSQVDIGFHYIATASGVPTDTDGDALADYLEDVNGNGTWQSTETKWQTSGVGDPTDTDGDGVSDYIEWLQGRSGSVSNAVSADLSLEVLVPLK